jgi:hypothetical protein
LRPADLAAYLFPLKETYMKMRHIALALALTFSGGVAIAADCSSMMSEVDAILATNPEMPDSVMDEVKELRADGQKQLDAGKADKCVEAMQQALFLLGK